MALLALELVRGLPSIEIREFGGGLTALIYLGADIENGMTFFADVSVTSQPGGGRHEFTFFILTRDVNSGEEREYWNGKDTKFLISSSIRNDVLTCILLAANILMAKLKPERVTIVTHDPNLPDKALVKYSLLIKVFHDLGYKITVADPYHGRRLWWAELSDA